MGVRDAKGAALKLAELSLIDLQLGEHRVIRCHDLILNYAAGRLREEGRWVETHQRLLDLPEIAQEISERVGFAAAPSGAGLTHDGLR